MLGRGNPNVNRRTARMAVAAAALTSLGLSACGGADEPAAAAPTTVAATSTTTSTTSTPTTVAANTTSTTTQTATTTTTTATPTTSTVVRQQTQPVAPPADAYAGEPVIEVGSLAIPKLGVDTTMYEGIRLTTFDLGPGHWPGSAMPGEVGNVVIGGHRTSENRIFRHVDQLEPGDEILLRDEAGEHRYLVDRVEIVEPTAMWIIDPTDTATATLFACHPPGSTSQRIVVFADLAT